MTTLTTAAPAAFTERHGVRIDACPPCQGSGFADGSPATSFRADLDRAACPRCGGTGENLDQIVSELSVFESFQELLEAPDYRPTIHTFSDGVAPSDMGETSIRRRRALADAYDQAQSNLGDDRRAYRGG